MIDARAQYEIDWHFASRDEQLEELRDCLREDDPPPPCTTARDIFDRVRTLGPLLVAHRVLRRLIDNHARRRAEADRFLRRARVILDELDEQTATGEALCDVLGAPYGLEGVVGP